MSPAEEHQAAREGAGLATLPERKVLDLSGPDVARFLHNMCSNDVNALPTFGGCLAAFCDRTGRMQALVRIRKFEDCHTLDFDAPPAAELKALLDKFIIMDRVEVKEISSAFTTLGLYGPKAPEILKAAGLETDVPPFHFKIHGKTLVGRFDLTGDPGFELAVRDDDVRARLVAAGAVPIGEEALETLRIENGFPKWGVDMGPEELPMEAELTDLAVDYEKGCFLGQEVIIRMRNFGDLPKRLRLLEVEGDEVPAPGDPIDGGEKVTSACRGPSTGKVLALGYLKKGHTNAGTKVKVGGRAATVTLPPFQSTMRSSPA